jgi:uncharacterized protein YutE (UPF0331/DUF86 family)
MSTDRTELEILRAALPTFEAEGYQVFLDPHSDIKPSFLGEIVPDAIAIGPNDNLVIEIVRASKEDNKKVKALSELVKQQKGWKLRVLRADSLTSVAMLTVENRGAILKRVEEARLLASDGHFEAALLICWAAMEATARYLEPNNYSRPQTPGRIIETLAGSGTLLPSEASDMRKLADKRNKIIHGQLDVKVEKKEVDRFCDILIELLKEREAA